MRKQFEGIPWFKYLHILTSYKVDIFDKEYVYISLFVCCSNNLVRIKSVLFNDCVYIAYSKG